MRQGTTENWMIFKKMLYDNCNRMRGGTFPSHSRLPHLSIDLGKLLDPFTNERQRSKSAANALNNLLGSSLYAGGVSDGEDIVRNLEITLRKV